jgi:hypothetical protein
MIRRFVASRFPCIAIEALEPRNMMSANHPPVAVISTSDLDYHLPAGVLPAWENDSQGLMADDSFDPDGAGEQLTYEWDANNDGVFEQTGMRAVFYPKDQPGDYPVTLRVTDQHGASSTVTNIMRVKDVKPALELHFLPYTLQGQTQSFYDEYFRSDHLLPEFDKIVSIDWDMNYDGVTFDSDVVADRVTVNFDHVGVYQFASRGVDDDGDVGITVVRTTVIAHASSMQVTVPQTVQGGEWFNIQAAVTNQDVPNTNFMKESYVYSDGLNYDANDPSRYAFSQPGKYMVSITARSLAGENFTYLKEITVVAPPAPTPTPIVTPTIPQDDSKDQTPPAPNDDPIVVIKRDTEKATSRTTAFASTTHTISWAPLHTSDDREDNWLLLELND